MKVRFVEDMDVEEKNVRERDKHKIAYREVRVRNQVRKVPYFPAGTEYEMPESACVHFCFNGEAVPADEETRDLVGLSDVQLKDKQRRRWLEKFDRSNKDAFGLSDYELAEKDIISGYNADGSVMPGPKWDEYQAALKAENEKDEDDE